MRAVRLVQPGSPLEDFELPVPRPAVGEVLVRIRAAGICHSDVHYRAGRSPVSPLPLTLGHEIAGEVVEANATARRRPGDRVVLHYLVTCGACPACAGGTEQFCPSGLMLGHFTDGGFAEHIAVPERNALVLPDEIPFEAGATLMCASATALHSLRKGRLAGGETLAVFGVGGLGFSAVQLGRALGARDVFAIDTDPAKRQLAARYGAIPIDPAAGDPADQIRAATAGRGVDVAVELIGLPTTMRATLRSVAPLGRAVLVGLADRPLEIDTYRELLGSEAELIGSNDHLLAELPLLLDLARRGSLDLTAVVSRRIPLEAAAINATLDDLGRFAGGVRTVVIPGT
jgi:2-desacetyl-2-hydroxyethyl bacteriochlorophyllide A dehydrogenase